MLSILGWCGLLAACGAGPEEHLPQRSEAPPLTEIRYLGSDACADCHASQFQAWSGSHHALAMQTATPDSVAGRFPDGDLQVDVAERGERRQQMPIVFTFGVEPLQQYLVDAGGGRLQAHPVAWDNRVQAEGGQRWFDLQSEPLALDDPLHWLGPAGRWNHMCADCHSTAVQKGYDPHADTYDTRFAEVSVGCEACHGPGQAHVEQGFAMPGAQADQLSVCAPCHSRRTQLAEGFVPGQPLLDFYQPQLLEPGLYHADGQIQDEVFVYGSFNLSAMHGAGVVCGDCHEPHSATTLVTGDALCLRCHGPGSEVGFPTAPRGDFAARSHTMHAEPVACVDCHMPATTYMQIDPRRDHSFRVPRPDLTVALGVPDACAGCHDEGAQWAADAISRHTGRAPQAHFASVLAAARQAEPKAMPDLVNLARNVAQPPLLRATAQSLLAGYASPEVVQVVAQGLLDDHPMIRIGALRAVRSWPPGLRHQYVEPLLDDPLLAVRNEARQALVPVFDALSTAARNQLRPHLMQLLTDLSLHMDTAEGRTARADVYRALGDLTAAEAELKSALRLNPSWVPGLVNLADLYRLSGRDSEGGPLLLRAAGLTPEDARVLVARALWLIRQNTGDAERAEAIELIRQAWTLNPRDAYVTDLYEASLRASP